jgi:hypothetical protein
MIDLSADPSRQNVSPIQSIDELTAKISRSRVPFSNAMIPKSRVTSVRRSTVHVRFCPNSGLKSDIAPRLKGANTGELIDVLMHPQTECYPIMTVRSISNLQK